ncbi:MAG: hypothetical protein H6817_05510 [Phycisphaerales bacterium]|nr:hypothetical protein [Phycisphaerales bacterium]
MFAGFCCAGAAAGCAQSRVDFIDLDFRRLPSEAELVDSESVRAAYWWLDGDTINISAVRGNSHEKQISRQRRMDFSLVLPGIPAERARDYQLTSASLRCYVRQGADHARYRSLRGIASVWELPGNVLRVKFRLIAGREIFHILTGWTDVGQTVLAGEFRARYDETQGQAVLQRSESGGMTRAAQPNTPVGARPGPVPVTGPPVKRRK